MTITFASEVWFRVLKLVMQEVGMEGWMLIQAREYKNWSPWEWTGSQTDLCDEHGNDTPNMPTLQHLQPMAVLYYMANEN